MSVRPVPGVSVVVEPGPDGCVVVRGIEVDQVRARLLPKPRGRPPKHPQLVPSQRDLLRAIAELAWLGVAPDERWLADQLGCTRAVLRAAIKRHFGSTPKMRRFIGEPDVIR